jgi:MinD-like ATPase involved in chromosome partitioning or flagellar assembly
MPELVTRVVVGYKNWRDMQLLSAALEKEADLEIVSAQQSAQGVFDDATGLRADVVILSPMVTGYTPSLIQDLLLWVHAARDERASDAFVPLSREVLATVANAGWQARTVAIWSPKGGVGKTWFSVNLAAALGVVGMRKTLLVDADMNKADAHVYLHLPEQRNLFGLANQVLGSNHSGKVRVEPTVLPRFVTHYRGQQNSKLDLLVGIPRMHLAGSEIFVRRARTRDFMVETIRTASNLYDFRILDVGQDFNHPIHWACIQEADIVLVIVTPELHAVNDVKNVLPPLRDTFGDLNKFELVINRWDEAYGISQAELLQVLGMVKFGVVPDAPMRCIRSINTHMPVVLDRTIDDISDAVMTVGSTVFPPLEEIWLAKGGKIGGSRKFRRQPGRRHKGGIGKRLLGMFVETN